MKVHKYQIEVLESEVDWTHKMGQTQTRLYIPNQGVLGYKSKSIDFFSDDQSAISEAETVIKVPEIGKKRSVKYFGQVELPDDMIAEVVSAGKSLNQAKTEFEKSTKAVLDIIGR